MSTTEEANKIVAWIDDHKAHIFAGIGIGVACIGYALKLLTFEQALGIATVCGAGGWFKQVTNTQTKQLTQVTDQQTATLVQHADINAEHINEVSKATTEAAVTALRPDIQEHTVAAKIEQTVAKKAAKKSK
jgi:hypothetical protein